MPKGFYYLISAQFASALADNALLILGIYFLNEQGYPGWWAPLLKFSLTLSYVVLASLVGPVADAFPKNQLMAVMNCIKMMGVVMLLSGVHPVFAFALIGLAASVYAPSKYGLVTESVASGLLVRANAWLEVSIVLSVILGVAVGGALVGLSDGLPSDAFGFNFSGCDLLPIQTKTMPAMALIVCVYLVAALLNMGIRPMARQTQLQPLKWQSCRFSSFWKMNQTVWTDPLGGISLYITTLYWGVGAVVQFAVLVWADQSLGLSLKSGSFLQALVAVGVIVGAFSSGYLFKLHSARQAIPWGLMIAILLPITVSITELHLAVFLLLGVGFSGGILLVPMNALLQHRGMRALSAGRSIAVQGFNENLCVLLMLSAYSALLAWGVTLQTIMLCLSGLLVLGTLPVVLATMKVKFPFRQT